MSFSPKINNSNLLNFVCLLRMLQIKWFLFFSFLKNIHVSSLKKKQKHFSQYTLNKIELWNFSILQLCSSIFKSYCSWFMAHKFYDHMVHVLIFGTYEYHIDNKSILNKNIFKVFKLAFHTLRLNTNFSTFKKFEK